MARNIQPEVSFNDRLILFRYFLHLFGKSNLASLAGEMKDSSYEGLNDSQNTHFYSYLDMKCAMHPQSVLLSRDALRLYDENICRYARQIGEKRGGLTLKYFQYIALLFTEIYLDRYFTDPEGFAADLNRFSQDRVAESLGLIMISPFTPQSMNKLAFMSATGSGKTLIMHINILQYLHYLQRARRNGQQAEINQVIVLAPNEGMSAQHLQELQLSSIRAEIFEKDRGFLRQSRDSVIVIDMNKLKEEGKQKTVSVDSFEQNNLVLVDEAHRGLAGDVWYDYRNRLSCDGGFAFEYSATFKQALKGATGRDIKTREMLDEYSKCIIMDYSYKYFFEDGFGKDYRIYNLRENISDEQKYLYLTGCLLSFYQQMKLLQTYQRDYAPFDIEKPLLVFVGNRVTATTGKDELTDVEEVLHFIDEFAKNRLASCGRIESVLSKDTGLVGAHQEELFYQDFEPLRHIFGQIMDTSEIYRDILRLVFNTDTAADEPRLHMDNLKGVDGEIALRIGEQGDTFGVISIGDTAKLISMCQEKGIVTGNEEFSGESLFQNINDPASRINVLIGSRKFSEGWSSWRVSTMGLINFAKGEGSQAIQLFGRGVRLHGYRGCLKRSGKLDIPVAIPRNIRQVETLTIFGIKAQYMEDFKRFLELEDMPVAKPIVFRLPVISRFDAVKDKRLSIIRLPAGVSYKKQAARIVLAPPDKDFADWLLKNKAVIDCRSKVQTIDSNFSHLQLVSTTQEHVLPAECIPLLHYQHIFEELQRYKNEKTLYNLSIEKDSLQKIMQNTDWCGLIIPEAHIRFDSIEKLALFSDFAVSLLKLYIDKYYKHQRNKWEAPRLSYQDLAEDDSNFVDEYAISYMQTAPNDAGTTQLTAFVKTLSDMLSADGGLTGYEYPLFHNNFFAFDFRQHLYAPLIAMKGQGLQISISPVSLNEGEKRFVDKLRDFYQDSKTIFADKSLYLLRNKSKTGMGFFEAGNFYPDYVLWIDTKDTQYITFVDPKGLRQMQPYDAKIKFYQTIKEHEARMQRSSPDKKIVLNSFILSNTPSAEIGNWWNKSKEELEELHVLCLDNSDCIEKMIMGILT